LKKISIAILLLLAGHSVQCQPTRSPLQARYTTLGAYSKNHTDAFSGSYNQAALAHTKVAGAGVFGERRFLLKELSNFSAAIVWPFKKSGAGLSARYFGGEQFNATQLGLGYGKQLHEKIDIGLQINYNSIRLLGYGNDATLNFEAGVLLHLTNKLHLGMHVYNPVGGRFGQLKNEQLAAVYTTGLGYDVSAAVVFCLEFIKQEDQPLTINAGMQYSFAHQLYARLGMASATGNTFAGLGIQWKLCRIDLTTSWQAQLGFTPAIMLLFNFHHPNPAAQD
jgi:hypothetical protein